MQHLPDAEKQRRIIPTTLPAVERMAVAKAATSHIKTKAEYQQEEDQ